MAEVVPLLTPQGWQLVTPVAASGAATGGAVGGTAGLALTAAGAGLLALAFLMARRASQKAATAKGAAGKPAGVAGAKPSRGLPNLRGLLNRLKPSAGAAGGSRTGGAPTGRGRTPGRGGGSSTGGGAGTGSGGPRRGTGRLAGLRSRISRRKPATGGRTAGTGTFGTGSRSGPGSPRSKSGPGLVRRARNLGRARKLGAARERASGQPGSRTRTDTSRSGGIRRGLGYLARGRKPTSAAAKPQTSPKTGSKGGTVGPAGEKHGRGIRGVVTGVPGALRGIGRASRDSKPGSFSPTNKRERLAARKEAAGGDTTPAGRRGTSAVARRAIDNATSTPIGKRRRTMGANPMPSLRRPTINKTGLASTGASRLGNTPTSGPSPFAPVIEACAVAAQSYTPENALRAIAWYEGMPELIEALAGMFAAHARKNQEDFYLYPAAAEIANALGMKFAAYKGPCEDARAAFESAHAEDLTKIRDPKPNQDKWDIVKNR